MRRGAAVGAAVLGLVAVAATATYLVGTPELPASGSLFVVRDADSVRSVAERLQRAGVIRSALALRVWARASGADRRIKPGEYRFSGDLGGVGGVLAALTNGAEAPTLTIPEGLTVREIAALLAWRGYASADSVLCLASDPEFLLAAGVPGPQLEGYLFPDTYRLSSLMSPGEILAMMVRRFHERFDAARYRRLAERGMSLNELVTLASIIEKETAVASERPLVATVFYNRLRLGMALQSDPTVIYGIPDFSGNLTRADLMRPTPFNTYVVSGLPPSPIANPGIAAIDAALAPAEAPYLYFVSKNDGSHQFSVTLAEHNRAVAEYQRPRR
jgi:UPF0755 protein